jgi:hypothetical protein
LQASLKRRTRVPGSSVRKEKDGSTTSSGAADPPLRSTKLKPEDARARPPAASEVSGVMQKSPCMASAKPQVVNVRECASAREETAATGRRRELTGSRRSTGSAAAGRLRGSEVEWSEELGTFENSGTLARQH